MKRHRLHWLRRTAQLAFLALFLYLFFATALWYIEDIPVNALFRLFAELVHGRCKTLRPIRDAVPARQGGGSKPFILQIPDPVEVAGRDYR